MKKILVGLWGLVQGIIGMWWNIWGFIFILHPDSEPGSKEWEEDKIFIPIGYIMLIIWLIAMLSSYYKLKKSKSHMIIFSITWVVSTICMLFVLQM